MVWVATESDEVVNVAFPDVMGTVAARVTAPSVKVTLPVGVPAPGATAATVAVKVTTWPKTDGLTVELSVVLEDALFTTWGDAESFSELGLKLVAPL
jgi:hypothetical protein